MGIGIAIAAIAIAATVASDIGFSVEESKKQDELNSALKDARSAINDANNFYQNVYKVLKTRLDNLKQSIRKLPPEVVDKLNTQLKLGLDNPDQVLKDVGYALGAGQVVAGIAGLVSFSLTSAGIAAADGIVADIGAVAGAAGAVLAVVGFGLTLYSGIKALNKLNDAIDKVNARRRKAEAAEAKMKNALDGILRALHLQVGRYESLKKISDDWSKLAKNFDTYSTAFDYAITGFAMGKNEAQVKAFVTEKGSPTLNDDILVLAKLIEENILDMMRKGKKDEEIIEYYAKENPKEGLRFVMNEYFVSTLRMYV